MSKGWAAVSRRACCGCVLVLLVGAGVASAVPIVTGGGQGGVTTDLFDISQGADDRQQQRHARLLRRVAAAERDRRQRAASRGRTRSSPTVPRPARVEFINFRTASPSSLTNYTATLADDSDNPANPGDPNRGSTAFRLYTSPDANFTSLQLVSEAALTPSYSNTLRHERHPDQRHADERDRPVLPPGDGPRQRRRARGSASWTGSARRPRAGRPGTAAGRAARPADPPPLQRSRRAGCAAVQLPLASLERTADPPAGRLARDLTFGDSGQVIAAA